MRIIKELGQADVGKGDLQAFVRTKGSDIIHKPALVHQAMAMLAHSHIVEPVFGNDVVQTPQQTKFLLARKARTRFSNICCRKSEAPRLRSKFLSPRPR